jgi:hypothetical protein
MIAALDHHDFELGAIPVPVAHDLGFLDSMDQLEDRLAPVASHTDSAFWHVPTDSGKAFVPVIDVTVDETESRRPRAAHTVALSLGFVLLMLAGAAASAFVFADRFGRLLAQ